MSIFSENVELVLVLVVPLTDITHPFSFIIEPIERRERGESIDESTRFLGRCS